MPHGVTCRVSNCNFWENGNKCNAKEIMIELDNNVSHNVHEEFAEDEFGKLNSMDDHASQSSATCCLTFQPKE
ncbi:DUF1540 domain-containing protein [Paenibacillus yanchengensis]|uniref:DUF1540 domain-containing protein n=1 Tax=Paenibacillus yanchengensis TaxID=2035833 RepID=A0ABW4YKN3_9BACL